MGDKILKIGESIVQHGKENDRIYLMKLHKSDLPNIISKLDEMSKKFFYTKIFAKVPSYATKFFLNKNYIIEAHIPKFYKGKEDAFFMAKYFCKDREAKKNKGKINKILKTAIQKDDYKKFSGLNKEFNYRKCRLEDAADMARLYDKVFETYPFPIKDPNYIKETMNENVEYFGIWHKGNIIALASCEMDLKNLNVEMTDFATLPEYRGNKFALFLLNKMEQSMRKRGIKTAYTIARSISYAMNITFSKLGYIYTGTLTKNTNISGDLETMNVWYKSLNQEENDMECVI
ncbi:putative beta-lysine N-acetyltransferase [Tepidibacter aestuarii]|uniref:putative beta-lysine N-acetyltransferase n=1 Tax=Tepidibacter aestuarii TaxID=2925782 RepID=UPI0020C0D5D5|nr:putative beta-lysine N-acetyltransferase [Tepidibacter aestuarii]CAH2212183.1 Beta-lysine N(6)-acetyltransferase [Tepidibacter aestuarii]